MRALGSLFHSYRAVMGVVIAVHVVVLGIKCVAYRITGSTAVLSDALEGIVNLVASVFALASLWFSSLPPDDTHPYGHGKIEYFAVGFEGALIVTAAAVIFHEAVPKLFSPLPLRALSDGTAVMAGGAAIQLAAVALLYVAEKKTSSPTLMAEGRHLLSDILSTVAVIGGLILAVITGYYRIDPLIAIAVALYILLTGLKLMWEAFHGLMDKSDPLLLQKVAEVLQQHQRDCWIDIHQLRVRRQGRHLSIDLHLILPRDMHLWEAHREARELEQLLRSHFARSREILIRLDPCEEPHCAICRTYGCGERRSPHREDVRWDGATLSRRVDS